MARYNFEIGTDLGSMDNIEDVVTNPPYQESFVPAEVSVDTADALVSRHGWGTTALRWGFITVTDRNALKTYCTGDSVQIYLRLKDDTGTWVYCDCILVWPQKEEPPIADRILDFRLEVRVLENLGASP